MSRIMLCTVAAIMIATIGVNEVKADSSLLTGLVLNIQPRDLRGTATNRFAINEPVWLSVALQNTSSVPISLWVDHDEGRGLTCQPAHGYEARATMIPRDIPLERNFKHLVLDSGEEIRIDVPISEFFRVQEEGAFFVACEMGVKDDKEKFITVNAVGGLQFTNGLKAQEISMLVDQLQEQFDSGDEDTRVRMVKSSGSCPPSAVMEFLAKALSDKSERVQLAAVEVLSSMSRPKERVLPLLQKAAKSADKSVRRRAKMAVERRQGR